MSLEKECTNELSSIKKIVAIMSGKGGVGKSSVTSLISVAFRNMGHEVGILDADVTGPSIPKLFGINSKRAASDGCGIYPIETATGIKVASLNLMIDDEDAPVIWRGPLISNVVKQFYTDVVWGKLDYLFIDLPPGTGDVPLTIMQSLPLDGVIVVSSPQDLVQLIVKKSINMTKMLEVPLLGIVENMSYLLCPHCGEKIYVFGKNSVEGISKEMDIDLLARLPIDPELSALCDEGRIEAYAKLSTNFPKELAGLITDRLEAVGRI